MTTLTRQEKEAVIMEEISDKTLSFGCEIILPEPNYPKIYKLVELEKIPEGNDKYGNKYILSFGYSGIIFIKELSDIQIIGHPIYPHHILQRASNNHILCKFNEFGWIKHQLLDEEIKRDLSKDLYGQSDETIDSLYSLVNIVEGK